MEHTESYRFGRFRLFAERRELLADGVPVRLGTRAFDILLLLVQRHGHLVTKKELMAAVWTDTVIEENTMVVHVAALRRALRDGTDNGRYILTEPGRGYRFVAEIDADRTRQARSPAPPPFNLPLQATSFVGRAVELAEIKARLDRHRFVTLAGAGGVGKTRLALEVGADLRADFPDGVWLLELAPLSDPALVAEALCTLLGISAPEGRSAVDAAAGFFKEKRLLLLLDNCEHLIVAAAQLADALVKRCPEIRVLATSRERLGVAGESVYRTPSLGVPPVEEGIGAAEVQRFGAVQLFVDRAGVVMGAYTLRDEDAPIVAAICQRLDGVALAIELAAARLNILKPAQLLSRLTDRFRLLTGGNRMAVPRQQTLRATIDWSYDLLSEPERILLRRLSVFADGWSIAGATAVCGGNPIEDEQVLDLISALVDKSLVATDLSRAEPRFRLLETTREYAVVKLKESDETSRTRRLAEYLIGFYDRANQDWPVMATERWLAVYDREIENLRLAIGWAFGPEGDSALGVALVAQTLNIADEMSLFAEQRRWAERALGWVDDLTPKSDAARIHLAATAHVRGFGQTDTIPMRRLTVALARESGDSAILAHALAELAGSLGCPGKRNDEARALLDEAITVLKPLGETKLLGSVVHTLGALNLLSGEPGAGRQLIEEALAIGLRLGDRSGFLLGVLNLASCDHAEANTAMAISRIEEALIIARQQDVKIFIVSFLTALAGYRLAIDQVASARNAAREGLCLANALCIDECWVRSIEYLGLASALDGTLERAVALLGFTEAWYRGRKTDRGATQQKGYERLVSLLGAALPQDRIDLLMAEGASWSRDEATEAALAD